MTDTLWIWTVINLIETGLCLFLISGILPVQREMSGTDRVFQWIVYTAALLLTGIFIKREPLFSSIAFLLTVAVLFGAVWAVQRRDVLLCAGVVLNCCSCFHLTVYILLFLLSIFIRSDVQGDIFLATDNHVNELICAIRAAALAILLPIVWKIRNSGLAGRIRGFQTPLLILGAVASLLVLEYQNLLEYGFVYSTTGIEQIKNILRDGMLSFLTALILAAAAAVLFLKNRIIKSENDILLMKEETEEKKYREISSALEMNRELVHDTRNHYLVIREYAGSGEYDKLHDYVEELLASFVRVVPRIYTGNRILDLVLEEKRMIAGQKGINFELFAVPVSHLPFENREICSLFGNLLDNAIEACERMEGERYIHVKIERQRQMLFVEISNSARGPEEGRDGKWRSSKKDGGLHGYGLKSVRRIVESYGGIVRCGMKEKEFVAEVTFFDVD